MKAFGLIYNLLFSIIYGDSRFKETTVERSPICSSSSLLVAETENVLMRLVGSILTRAAVPNWISQETL